MQQVALLQGQTSKAQREAQHMRELVKAQHAKREKHALSLQTELDRLQQECMAKDIQVSARHLETTCLVKARVARLHDYLSLFAATT